MLSPAKWHERFLRQSNWTQNLRKHLFSKMPDDTEMKVLDVGCGTGALLPELVMRFGKEVIGIDINVNYLDLARKYSYHTLLLGDAHKLPFLNNSFDVCLCHFLLLWVQNPQEVLYEMRRVTCKGGWVFALAEPDYGGRIDYPRGLIKLGDMQTQALIEQGADPFIGRQLRGLFNQVNLVNVEVGVLGGLWDSQGDQVDFDSEWEVIHSDLSQIPIEPELLENWKMIDAAAHLEQSRILYVPTFYAMGRVP